MMAEHSDLQAPLHGQTKRLLRRLRRRGLFGSAEKRRERLREKIIALGSPALRTVLKHSRWEGWNYRDDVYEIMERLAGEPIALFIAGLSDSDGEIRWSCCKWLRDKGEGHAEAVGPLLDYLRARPREGDVTSALGVIGSEAIGPVVDLIVDESAPHDARMEALIGFPFREVGEGEVATLHQFMATPNLDPEFHENIPALLKAVGADPALM